MKHYFLFFVLAVGIGTWIPVQSEVKHLRFAEGTPFDRTLVHVTSDPWQPENFENGTPIPAPYMNFVDITLDGLDNEPEWANTEEIVIPMAYGTTDEVFIKALHTDEDVYIQIRWADNTENREHHPWVWNSEEERYVIGHQTEDSALLSFEAGCEWSPSLLAGQEFDFDVWHWMAARSNPVGQAWDRIGTTAQSNRNNRLTRYQSRDQATKTWNIKFTDDMVKELNYSDWNDIDRWYRFQAVYPETFIWMPLDGSARGESTKISVPLAPPPEPPEDETKTFPRFTPVKLEGDQGEVAAKGHWKDGFWTVEFRRALVTPSLHITDVIFNRLTQFSVHIFDQVERIDQSSESGRLWLQFLPKSDPLPGEDELLLAGKE